MEEGRAHEERDVALAPASHGRRLARPVFLAAVALALLSFAALVSGAEISSALEKTRDMIGAKARVPTPAKILATAGSGSVKYRVLMDSVRSETAHDSAPVMAGRAACLSSGSPNFRPRSVTPTHLFA